jgi:hypothetical protein
MNKMTTLFRPTENRPHTQKYVVYRIPYSCGKVYNGQMGHHIPTRTLEHIRDTRLENP